MKTATTIRLAPRGLIFNESDFMFWNTIATILATKEGLQVEFTTEKEPYFVRMSPLLSNITKKNIAAWPKLDGDEQRKLISVFTSTGETKWKRKLQATS